MPMPDDGQIAVGLLSIAIGFAACREDLFRKVDTSAGSIGRSIFGTRTPGELIASFFLAISLCIAPIDLFGVRALGVFEGAAVVALMLWVSRIRGGRTALGSAACAAASAYALLTMFEPSALARDAFHSGTGVAIAGAALLLLAIVLAQLELIALVRARIDEADRVYAKTFALTFPLFAVCLLAGFKASIGYISLLVGEVVFMVGMGQHFVQEGRRTEFLGRFLSSQVRSEVRTSGMSKALEQKQVEISVIFCDLRGFTAFSQRHSSKDVAAVLKQYYDAVSKVVAGFEATIKDFAGDGILILIGAPLPVPDHAARALKLAQQALADAREVLKPWSAAPDHLGIGFGVATGVVTVGVIESVSRLEYTAIGPSVNLGARLCAAALDGEIRVDQRTAELAKVSGLREMPAVSLKGYEEPVANFALA